MSNLIIRLGDVATYINGYAFKPTDWSEEGRPIIRIQDLTGNAYQANRFNGTSPEKYVVRDGDILISWSASLGIYVWHGEEAVLNQHIFKVVFNKVDIERTFFIHQVEHILEKAAGEAHGATMKHLTKPVFDALPFVFPPINEQKHISEELDRVSEMILLQKRQLEKLDELVKSRFIELFGTVRDNPYHFPTATLKEVCHKITDGKHGGCEQEADSGYYYVGAREIYDGAIHYGTAPQITCADFAKDYRRCNIEQGDMVIVNTGATIGKSAIASSPLTERTLLQKSVALIKVKTDVISAEFLRYCYMANPSMYMVESASAQPNLLLSKMNATVIYLPPLELQQQFSAFIAQVDKSKFCIRRALRVWRKWWTKLLDGAIINMEFCTQRRRNK